MHKETGYILSITPKDGYSRFITNDILFGPRTNTGLGKRTVENLTTNGLKPFPSLESAQKGENELKRIIRVKNANILHIDLTIADNLKDFELLKNEKNLVVIRTEPILESTPTKEIIGRFDEKACHLGTITGAKFRTNGRNPFTSYSNAEESVREINRQGQCAATIATLVIRKIH